MTSLRVSAHFFFWGGIYDENIILFYFLKNILKKELQFSYSIPDFRIFYLKSNKNSAIFFKKKIFFQTQKVKFN